MIFIAAPVHPRACGERPFLHPDLTLASGSSPRVRGTHVGDFARHGSDRFIPARAGNATTAWPTPTHNSVHPRACGERLRLGYAHSGEDGSSPRVRGTRVAFGVPRVSSRFIPARAGNARSNTTWTLQLTVHPRACGERAPQTIKDPWASGSSPRVRGTLGPKAHPAAGIRFIPARAGNASMSLLLVGGPAVHPRACGERVDQRARLLVPCGSSPRVRGTRTAASESAARWRFIPARAGNAISSAPPTSHPAVHPRACGERVSVGGGRHTARGSSPRVRGTRPRRFPSAPTVRFIPARAGNARWPHDSRTSWTVHPRACGERMSYMADIDFVDGSSPRVRGTPELARWS